MNEFNFIDSLKKFQNASSRVVRGIGDDAAVLALDGRWYQLFTTDMLVEGVHFTLKMPPVAIGHKAMACSVSDIAAMGGIPTCAVVSVGIPRRVPPALVARIYQGMHSCARRFKVSLVGGDTVRAGALTINVALLGEVEKKYLVARDGARPGDMICVTGRLGGSFASGRHLTFTPRFKEARWLVQHARPTAMMDISDGLAGDLRHILKASKAGAVLDERAVPCHNGVSVLQALSDGEDFELLFTLAPARAKVLARSAPFAFTVVGEITAASHRLMIKDISGKARAVEAKGYTHF
jgi:thiamine-monophosphate kinase